MEAKSKILNFLGLARKAGKHSPGGFMTEKTVKGNRACLVLVSEEASDNTKKSFLNMCTHYKVPIYLFAGKEELGGAIGKEMCTTLAVTDPGFSRQIEKLLIENGGSEYEGK